MVEKYAQEEEKSVGELKVLMTADHVLWHFKLNQDIAHYNAQWAMRVILGRWVRVCRLKSAKVRKLPKHQSVSFGQVLE